MPIHKQYGALCQQDRLKSDLFSYVAIKRRGGWERRGGIIEALTGAVMGAISMAAVGFLLQGKAAKE
jgi:hypothetical protein